jgi:uncharacterized protein YjiS (DUF1127 family)
MYQSTVTTTRHRTGKAQFMFAVRRWLQARHTAKKLNALPDCMLRDIGIGRNEIGRFARRTADGTTWYPVASRGERLS